MRASVIVVNYNNHVHLEACLRSLAEHHSHGDEIILVDNASTDGSVAYVEANYPAVRILCNASNLGFAGGANAGAQHARGEYLAFLNPDTKVGPGWLEALTNALNADSQAGLATSKILLFDNPEKLNAAGNEIHISGITQCRGLGQSGEDFGRPGPVTAVSGAAFVIRRELFESLGGFDPEFFMYMEEIDLSWRARLAGRRCLYTPSSLVYHDYSLRFGHKKVFYQERNRYLMLLKSLRWPTLLVLAPVMLAAEAVAWGFVLLRDRKRLSNKLQAYAWIIENWPQILHARQETQRLRRVPDRELLKQTGFRLSFDQVDRGKVGLLARLVFDPCFFLLRALALALVWW